MRRPAHQQYSRVPANPRGMGCISIRCKSRRLTLASYRFRLWCRDRSRWRRRSTAPIGSTPHRSVSSTRSARCRRSSCSAFRPGDTGADGCRCAPATEQDRRSCSIRSADDMIFRLALWSPPQTPLNRSSASKNGSWYGAHPTERAARFFKCFWGGASRGRLDCRLRWEKFASQPCWPAPGCPRRPPKCRSPAPRISSRVARLRLTSQTRTERSPLQLPKTRRLMTGSIRFPARRRPNSGWGDQPIRCRGGTASSPPPVGLESISQEIPESGNAPPILEAERPPKPRRPARRPGQSGPQDHRGPRPPVPRNHPRRTSGTHRWSLPPGEGKPRRRNAPGRGRTLDRASRAAI